METIKDVEKTVEDEFNKDVDLVKDATGMDTWWVIWLNMEMGALKACSNGYYSVTPHGMPNMHDICSCNNYQGEAHILTMTKSSTVSWIQCVRNIPECEGLRQAFIRVVGGSEKWGSRQKKNGWPPRRTVSIRRFGGETWMVYGYGGSVSPKQYFCHCLAF